MIGLMRTDIFKYFPTDGFGVPCIKGKVRCIVDFIVENKIILEFKAKDFITKEDYFQTKRYLVTLNLKLALLINFRQKRLAPKRILNKDFINN